MNDDDEFDPPRSSWRSRCLWTAIGAAGIIGFLIYRDWQPAPPKADKQLQIMHDPAATPAARHVAAAAVGKTSGPAVLLVVPQLVDDLKSGDEDVRFLAAVALTRLGAKALSAKPALVQATQDAEPRVRQQSVQALAQMASDAEVVSALTAAAHDADFDVSGAAFVALRFQQVAGVEALVALLRDRDANVRRRAAIELGRLSVHAEIIDGPLHEALAHDGDDRVRAEALAALRKLSLLSVKEWLDACDDRGVRRTALSAFPTDAAAVPVLRRLLTSDDAELALRAASALGAIGPAAREAVDDLLARLDEEREHVLYSPRGSLGSIGLEAEYKPPELWAKLAEVNDSVKSLVLREQILPNPIGATVRAKSPFPPAGDRDMRHVANLVNLRYLDLANTDVGDAGLAHLAGLAKLEWLDLTHTRVTSAGLAHLARLSNLRDLRLDECRVNDEGLVHLKNLNRLERLQLDDTKITDAGLAHLAGLHQLKWLGLGKTKVTDAGMAHLAALDQLKLLSIYQTEVTDAGLGQLTKLNQLEKIGAGQGQFTTVGLAQLQKLTELRLNGASIGDDELIPISQLIHLKTLALTGTSLTDAGLKHLAPLRQLTELQLDSTATTDAGLAELKLLKHLQKVSLTKTHVTENGIEQLKRALPDVSISSDFGSDHYRAIGLQPAG